MCTLWLILGGRRICIKEKSVIPRIGEYVVCEGKTFKVSMILYPEMENVVWIFVKKVHNIPSTTICTGSSIPNENHKMD